MDVATTRFGKVGIEPADVLVFPAGLAGFEDCVHWVLLADADNTSLGWLQSVTRPEVAMPVVSPRRFVNDYQVRVSRSELSPIEPQGKESVHVLVVVGRNAQQSLTLNLKAPLVINLDRRMGKQVIANGDLPLQYELASQTPALRKIA